MTTTLLYCRSCDWQEVSANIRDLWDTRLCPGCGDIGLNYVRYEPHERAHASFVAKRQVP